MSEINANIVLQPVSATFVIDSSDINFTPTDIQLIINTAGGGGSGTPSGIDTTVQYNDGGAFGGNVNFTYNSTTTTLASPFYAGVLTTAAQPNITSVGTLTSLDVAGNILGGNSIQANYFLGDGSLLTGMPPNDRIINGTSNVVVQLDGAVRTSVANTPNVHVITNSGTTVNGLVVTGTTSLNAVSNVSIFGGNIGQVLSTNGSGQLSWADQYNPVTTTYAPFGVTLIDGLYLSGAINDIITLNDGLVYNVQETATTPGWNVEIDFSGVTEFNTVLLNYAYINGGSHVVSIDLYNHVTSQWNAVATARAGETYTQYQLGVLDSASYISVTNTVKLRLYHASAGFTGHTLQIDYAALRMGVAGTQGPPGPPGTVGTADYANTAGTVEIGAQPNITSVGTLTSLTSTGNISGANIIGTHYGAATGLTSIPGANVTGNVPTATTAGTVTTAAQPNITSVGTLTSLNTTGDVVVGGNLTVNGSSTVINANTLDVVDLNITVAKFATNNAEANGAGLTVAGANATMLYTAATNSWNFNKAIIGTISSANVAGTVSANAQPNITSHGTLTSLTVNGVTSLGSVGNVRVTGGTIGQVLGTNGSGNLSWVVNGTGDVAGPTSAVNNNIAAFDTTTGKLIKDTGISSANVELTTRKGTSNGYASLDATSLVPVTQLGTGAVDATKFLRGDKIWAVPGAANVGGVGSLTAFYANGVQSDVPVNALATVVDFTANGSLTLGANANVYHGSNGTYGWRDLTSSVSVKGSGPTSPSWTTLFGGFSGYVFSASTLQEAFADFHVGHDYAMGTEMWPHVHFIPTTINSGVVRWGIEFTVAKGHHQVTGSVFGASTTVILEQTIAANSQWKHFTTEVNIGSVIPATLLEPDSIIKVRLFRDAAHANDTYPDVVHAMAVDLHYQAGRLSTLNKVPNFYG